MKKYNYTEFILENMRIDDKKVHVYNVAYFCERRLSGRKSGARKGTGNGV